MTPAPSRIPTEEVGMETGEPRTTQDSTGELRVTTRLCVPGWKMLSKRTALETWAEGMLPPPQGQQVSEDGDTC